MPTVEEIMKLPIEQRHNIYNVNNQLKNIGEVIISYPDGTNSITLKGYEAYSFFWEKTYVKSPERAMDGAISNLDGTSTFISGHLKINFALMPIDDYRAFMKLIYKKNEFKVNCYDIVYDKRVDINMYFATQEMPKLWNIVSKIQGGSSEWENYVDLVGIEGCTVELIGTNTDNSVFENYFK